jgi:DNA-binding beta-propeller fold protein YncE
MVIGPDGNLYIADSQNDAVDKIVLSTDTFSTLIGGCGSVPFVNPYGVAFGPDGNLYVSDEGNGCGGAGSAVYEYTIGGTPLGTFVATNVLLTDPIDLVFGPDGNLYVTDSDGRVALFDGTTGAELPDFIPSNGSAGPLVNPTFLAFSNTTPEPATMGLIGLGLAAVLLRRRRKA